MLQTTIHNLQAVDHGVETLKDLFGREIADRHDVTVVQGSNYEKHLRHKGYQPLNVTSVFGLPAVRYFIVCPILQRQPDPFRQYDAQVSTDKSGCAVFQEVTHG